MAGTHGDLFHEIGRLVVAADGGASLDLAATSEDLSRRYANLGVPPDMMARAIARSLSAVGMSMALMRPTDRRPGDHIPGLRSSIRVNGQSPLAALDHDEEDQAKSASELFPSGVRLALLS